MDAFRNYIQNNKKEFAAILTISVFALILRLISLLYAGDLSTDEIYSYYFSDKNSLFDVVKSLYIEDLHTPLYFILLHFWIKIFNIFGLGENDAVMRLLGFIPAFLAVPFSFYIGKKLFNKKTGYFASIMLAISPFAIYYTTELRFYGTAFFFALLSSYFFVEYINSVNNNENTRQKNYKTALVISNLALLYTFNISFVFIFFQFLCAIIASKNKAEIIKTYALTGLFYIPGFIMAFHGIFAYKNAICSFARDIFPYKPAFLSIFLQSYFTGHFFYASNNLYDLNNVVVKNIFAIKCLFLILFPVVFCLAGFLKALFSKNKTLILFLMPALSFLVFEFFFAHFGMMSLIARYTLISYSVIIITCAYGFSLFKNKKLIFTLFLLFITSVSCFVFSKDANAIKKQEKFGSYISSFLDRAEIKRGDYILFTSIGKLYKRYIPKNLNYIDLEPTDMLLNGVKKYYPVVFDKNIEDKITQKNAPQMLSGYLNSNYANKNIETYLKEVCFNYMQKGQKLIIIVPDINAINDSKATKEKASLYYLLLSKISSDILLTCQKHLKLTTQFTIRDNVRPQNDAMIYVFEKSF